MKKILLLLIILLLFLWRFDSRIFSVDNCGCDRPIDTCGPLNCSATGGDEDFCYDIHGKRVAGSAEYHCACRVDGTADCSGTRCKCAGPAVEPPGPPPSPPPATPPPSTPPPATPPPPAAVFPFWLQTEQGDVHSNKDIIVSMPENKYLGDFFITSALFSTFDKKNGHFAVNRASKNGWQQAMPSYGRISYPATAIGFYAYFWEHFRPQNEIFNEIRMADISNFKGKVIKVSSQFPNVVNEVGINGLDLTLANNEERMIFLVNSNLSIEQDVKIASANNAGIIFVIAGDLLISDNVSRLDGFYLVDGEVKTGGVDKQLMVHGGILTSEQGKFNFRRIYADNSGPAEVFIYEPKYLILMTDFFEDWGMRWDEVSP